MLAGGKHTIENSRDGRGSPRRGDSAEGATSPASSVRTEGTLPKGEGLRLRR